MKPNIDITRILQARDVWPGAKIFPCKADKSPLTARGFKDATGDESVIAGWWRRWPYALVGLATGGGVLVIDTDQKKGKDGAARLAELEAQHGTLPPTLTVATMNGGKHRYFKYPPSADVRSSSDKLALGVDIRAAGGYVIAPPSGGYTVAINAPIATLPGAWLKLVAKPRRKLFEYLPKEEPAREQTDTESARDALDFIPADISRDEWVAVGMAIKEAGLSYADFDSWSATGGEKYAGKADTKKVWDSFTGSGVGTATLFFHARKYGYRPSAPVAQAGTRLATGGDPWPPLRRLEDAPPLPGFPLDTLPPEIRGMVEEVAATVQCDPAMPTVAALAAIATAAQRCALVQVGATHQEPLNVWLQTVADPSERKSEVFQKMFAPIFAGQADAARAMEPEIERAAVKFKLQSGRLAELEKMYSRASGDKAESILADIERLRDDMQEPPMSPRWTACDATPETMATILFQNGGRLTVLDAEGAGAIANAMGRYSTEGTKLENMLRAYRGDAMQIDRRNRHETLFHPTLTVCLALQNSILRAMGKAGRGQGFQARWLYSLPTSQAGSRMYRNRPLDGYAVDQYSNLVRRLMADLEPIETVCEPPEFPLMAITGEALQVWTAFHDAIEKDMADGGRLARCRDLGGKFAGQAVRLAGLLSIATGGAGAVGKPIPPASVDCACRMVAGYFVPHSLAAYELMFEVGADGVAERVVAWIRRHRVAEFSQADLYRDLRNGTGVETSADVADALETLAARGYVRRIATGAGGKVGRPPHDSYAVNPAALG